MKVTITGGDKLKSMLTNLAKKFSKGDGKRETVVVGFTQRYALYVHEIQAYHRVGQWKYLETPARQLKSEMSRIIQAAVKRKVPVIQALMLAGLRLQRAAQLLTPVDTSALKASAFTCPESDLANASQQAFERSENIRLAEQGAAKKKVKP